MRIPPSQPAHGRVRSSHQPSSIDEPAPESLDLREALAVVRRNWWIVLGITAASVSFAVSQVYPVLPMYRAQAAVRLANDRRALTNNLADDNQEYAYFEDRLASQMQVLRSREVAAHAVDSEPVPLRLRPVGIQADLLTDVQVAPDSPADSIRIQFDAQGVTVRSRYASVKAPYGAPVILPGLRFTFTAPAAQPNAVLVVLPREQAITMAVGGLIAKQREKSDVIDVIYTADDPVTAQRVVNAIVRAFATGDKDAAQGQARRRRVFIEEQIARNDSLLNQAQLHLAEFRSREQTFSTKDKFTAEQQGLSSVDQQRERLNSERALYEALIEGVRHTGSGSSQAEELRTLAATPAVASNPVIAQLYAQLALYQTRRDSMTTGPWANAVTHPDVQRLDTLISSLQDKLGKAAQSSLANVTTQLKRLEELRERNNSALQRLPAVEAEELRLSHEVESLRALGDQLRLEYQKSHIAEAVQAGQISILDLAASPGTPLGGRPTARLLLSLVVGFFTGMGAAFLRERLNTSISRHSDVQRFLHLTPLAVIPKIAVPAIGKSNGNGRKRRPLARIAHGTRGVNGQPPPRGNAPAVEAYVTLRTNLLFAAGTGAVKTMIVTSAAPGDGKSTVACNLATTFAQQHGRVLLVDCDLRRPRVHAAFGLEARPGLSDLLIGTLDVDDAIHATGLGGLDVIPAGQTPPNPSELLGSPAMAELIAQLAEVYDVIIFDTPPVLAVADAAILGSRTDGAVFVVRAGATEREAALNAIDQITAVGGRVLGAVLNDPDDRVSQFGGYYYYSEYYSKAAMAGV